MTALLLIVALSTVFVPNVTAQTQPDLTDAFGIEISRPETGPVASRKCSQAHHALIWKCIENFYANLLPRFREQQTYKSMWEYFLAFTRDYIDSLCNSLTQLNVCIREHKHCLDEEMTRRQSQIAVRKFATICSRYQKDEITAGCTPKNLTIAVSLPSSNTSQLNDDTACENDWHNLKQEISLKLGAQQASNMNTLCNECASLIVHFGSMYHCSEKVFNKYCGSSYGGQRTDIILNGNRLAETSTGLGIAGNHYLIAVFLIFTYRT